MRIPPSVIAMSVVVCVPFGLGIRDTIKRRDALSMLEDEQQRALEREREMDAEAAAERARDAEREEQRNVKRRAMYVSLLGKQKAALGEQFGVQVGDPAPADWEQKLGSIEGLESRDYERPGTELTGDNVIASVSFTIGDRDCDNMRSAANAAWGPGDRDGMWLDPEHNRRATIDGLLCTLRFDRVIDDAGWAKLAVAPLMGKTVAQAAKQLGQPTSGITDEERISWYLPGALVGRSQSELIADVEANKIVGWAMSTDAVPAQAEALAAQLEKLIKETPEHDDTYWVWSKHHVTASYGGNRFTVSVTR
ncbi:MAG: hypothetical protein QM831_16485 [Kofleriaceae bacterium]